MGDSKRRKKKLGSNYGKLDLDAILKLMACEPPDLFFGNTSFEGLSNKQRQQKAAAKQLLGNRIYHDGFKIWNFSDREFWKVIYKLDIPEIEKLLLGTGFKVNDSFVSKLDYVQLFFLDRKNKIIYRLNPKLGILLWESNGFLLEKMTFLHNLNFNYAALNHLDRKAWATTSLNDFCLFFPSKLQSWNVEFRQDERFVYFSDIDGYPLCQDHLEELKKLK